MSAATTREHIVEAADRLFYEQGFEHTSFADIADAVKISRGNFYYYFKTKDDILDAVIAARLIEKGAMLERWENEGNQPADRIRGFINILVVNQEKITRYGCPIGTLCTELAKLDHASQSEASKTFTLFRVWLRRQFKLLGRTRDADVLAMHLLARSQGVAVLAQAFNDTKFIKQEVAALHAWLDEQSHVRAAGESQT